LAEYFDIVFGEVDFAFSGFGLAFLDHKDTFLKINVPDRQVHELPDSKTGRKEDVKRPPVVVWCSGEECAALFLVEDGSFPVTYRG